MGGLRIRLGAAAPSPILLPVARGIVDVRGRPISVNQTLAVQRAQIAVRGREVGLDLPVSSYSTDFPTTENPISESGNWTHFGGSVWKTIETLSNRAQAAEYTELENDANAFLGSWAGGDDYEVIATTYHPSGTGAEVEILLRGSGDSTNVSAYEFLYNTGGSWALVKWLGPLHSFSFLDNGGTTASGPNGAQIRATVTGSSSTVITLYWRASSADSWTQLIQYTDSSSPHTTGLPGFGVYVHAVDSNINVNGFTHWQVSAL